MKIVVCATPEQYDQLLLRGVPVGVTIIMQSCEEDLFIEADIYFDLLYSINNDIFKSIRQKPVFVNEVIQCNNTIPDNYIRLNGWNSFLERGMLEIAAKNSPLFSSATQALDALGWKYQLVPDAPGMIAARVVAMIINEAYFALGEDISSKKEIDIAMKTGTNYPYGPFEWGEKIGLKNVYSLLKKLREEDERYIPAPMLVGEVGIGDRELT